MKMITFYGNGRKIKRVFDSITEKEDTFLGFVGKCDCYKNSCDCVTVASIRKDTILSIENIAIVGDSN